MLRSALAAPPLAGLAAPLRRLADRFRQRAADRDLLRTLARLDDHLLHDIGLGRHHVTAAEAMLEAPEIALWRALGNRHGPSPSRTLRLVAAGTRT